MTNGIYQRMAFAIGCIAMCGLTLAIPAPTTKPKTESELLGDQLAGKDSVGAQDAIVRVRDLMQTEPAKAVNQLRTRWLKAMITGGRYEDAAELALAAILFQPQNTQDVQAFQAARVRALLAAGKKPEALANAKSLFNIAPMKNTDDAMLLVAECFTAINPDSADRFRQEQIAGATTRPVTVRPVAAQSATGAERIESQHRTAGTALSGVTIDPKPYEDALRGQTAESYAAWTARGNLLLLSDKPKEAKAAFERAYSLAADSQTASAAENIARAIKAEDGNIGRANGFILSLRPESP